MKKFRLCLTHKTDNYRNFYRELMDGLSERGFEPDLVGDMLSETVLSLTNGGSLVDIVLLIEELGGRVGTVDTCNLFEGMFFVVEEL